jgi:hypothetical protein
MADHLDDIRRRRGGQECQGVTVADQEQHHAEHGFAGPRETDIGRMELCTM